MMRVVGALLSLVLVTANLGNLGLKTLFDEALDSHRRDGLVTVEEIVNFIQNTEAEASIHRVYAFATDLHQRLDLDRDGYVNWNEFMQHYSRLQVKDDLVPQQIHIALSTDPTEMVVMWSSSDNVSQPQVNFGTVSGVYTSKLYGTSDFYNVSYPGDIDYVSLPIHTVVLKGLNTSTRYYYTCGSNVTFSPELNFTTAPPKGALVPKVTWAMYGDMGTVLPLGFEVTKWLVAENYKSPFDVILHVGDIAYAGTGSDREIEPVWDDYMNQIQPLASIIPYQATVGNHEHYYNWTAYRHRWQMPWGDRANNKFWFSFDYANVHITAMSMDSNPYDVNSEQYAWLEQDLSAAYENAQKSSIPSWIILSGHRPFLCSTEDEYDQHCPGATLISTIEPLILKYHVDLVVTGHMHVYERTYPTINGTVSPPYTNNYTNINQPIYIVQGTSGAFIGEQWEQPQPAWSAFRKQEYGWGRVEITTTPTQSTIYYAFHGGEDQTVVDQLWLSKTK